MNEVKLGDDEAGALLARLVAACDRVAGERAAGVSARFARIWGAVRRVVVIEVDPVGARLFAFTQDATQGYEVARLTGDAAAPLADPVGAFVSAALNKLARPVAETALRQGALQVVVDLQQPSAQVVVVPRGSTFAQGLELAALAPQPETLH